jgi:hypothetical protein
MRLDQICWDANGRGLVGFGVDDETSMEDAARAGRIRKQGGQGSGRAGFDGGKCATVRLGQAEGSC